MLALPEQVGAFAASTDRSFNFAIMARCPFRILELSRTTQLARQKKGEACGTEACLAVRHDINRNASRLKTVALISRPQHANRPD
jgi:hypothetical protein